MTETWGSVCGENELPNILNEDFELYSSLADLQAETNKWTSCNYDDNGIGFPRDCGPNGLQSGQCNSKTRGGRDVAFYVVADLEEDVGRAYKEKIQGSLQTTMNLTEGETYTLWMTFHDGAFNDDDDTENLWNAYPK